MIDADFCESNADDRRLRMGLRELFYDFCVLVSKYLYGGEVW